MNPEHTPAWIGCSHPPDKITDFTADLRPSRAFGFEFPEKFETLAMSVGISIRLYNDKRFAPRSPDLGKHNPEESIRHSNFRPLVRSFHYGQLLAKRKVFGSEIRSDLELRPYEQNKIFKRFYHDYSLAAHANLSIISESTNNCEGQVKGHASIIVIWRVQCMRNFCVAHSIKQLILFVFRQRKSKNAHLRLEL
ncbi:MAG: hypothetical protein GY799_12430 [Desulfobulbaceae bacterium]|nr:hypothetical protein [Desulfobulbaceae bacterium]